MDFLDFFGFFWIFWIFFGFFLDFLDFLDFFGFLDFLKFLDFFGFFLDFFGFLGFLSKLLRLLLKVTKVTIGHQKLPKMGQNSKISTFFARRAKKASAEGRSPPQELEVGPRSGPYLLVLLILKKWISPKGGGRTMWIRLFVKFRHFLMLF